MPWLSQNKNKPLNNLSIVQKTKKEVGQMDGLMILGLVALDFAFTLALAKGVK
jgi:hypothetical protein